ncbi:hypothetical protein BDW72DRAFT_205203 [Aspergillus terricola var. indicus]
MALQSVFEMISFATTIVFADPDQFKYPVYISYGAIALAAVCFAAYVRRERGHLIHTSKSRGPGRSGPRRRTGCLTCRARKVRCDETKPTCANCTRLRLQCVYKSVIIPGMRIPRARSASTRSASSTTAAEASPESNDGVTGTAFRASEYRHHRTQQHTPFSTVSPGGPSPDFNLPFDMLGFIGEITSDFQQKHDDLTNGETIVAPSAAMQDIDGDHSYDQRQVVWDSGDVGIGVWEEQLLQHFREGEAPPTIFAPVDLEWRYVRDAILAESNRSAPGCHAVLLAVYCYSDMHLAWVDRTQPKTSPSYHAQASSEIQACLLGGPNEVLLKRVLMSVLLLMLAEQLISPETWRPAVPYLHTSYLLLRRFHPQIKSWTGLAHFIASCVSLLDIKALIAGRDGEPLAELGDLTSENSVIATPTTSPPGSTEDDLFATSPPPACLVTRTITSPAFTFFLATQQVTRRIIMIDLHHRSRGTVSDEFEVLQIAHAISADLESLWNKRPRILDLYELASSQLAARSNDGEASLLEVLAPPLAVRIVSTFRSYVANFLALFIYLHRVAFAIYPRTDRVYAAVDQIIRLAKEESSRPLTTFSTNSNSNSHTPPSGSGSESIPISFLWPLFIAALEGSIEQRSWIASEIQRMAALGPPAHPNAGKALLLLEEMMRRQDASRAWADSKCVRRELFTDFFVMI